MGNSDFEEQQEKWRWAFRSYLQVSLTKLIKTLLETRHLYQNMDANSSIIPDAETRVNKAYVDDYQKYANEVIHQRWKHETNPETGSTAYLNLILPTAKLYCEYCEGIEAHNPQRCWDILGPELRPIIHFVKETPPVSQVLNVSYLCQSCKNMVVVFLIQRSGSRVCVSGRSPMEKVIVEKFIPKQEQKYFSDAIIAFNSGQTLPALFMLRVFIEQYCNRMTDSKAERAEEAIKLYMDSLPPDFKSRFPSLMEIYRYLSDAIHKADDSEKLFVEMREKIEHHFEARSTFRLKTKFEGAKNEVS